MDWLNKIHHGDALGVLKQMPDEYVDCCITSPPYWGLRDYGVDEQLGLEKTFEEYITKLCDIFDQVKRVLKPTGTCWVVLGDSYNTQHISGTTDEKTGWKHGVLSKDYQGRAGDESLPSKCLALIPARFAIEMVNRGWILRNTLIWYKPNCMPSSAKDRFTVDFEYIFFFVKNRKYWFEQQFENEDSYYKTTAKVGSKRFGGEAIVGPKAIRENRIIETFGRNKRCVWQISTAPYPEAHFAVFPEALIETPIKAGCPQGGIVLDPFMGSGTTAVVARKLARDFIGIELNKDYIKMAHKRLMGVPDSLFR